VVKAGGGDERHLSSSTFVLLLFVLTLFCSFVPSNTFFSSSSSSSFYLFLFLLSLLFSELDDTITPESLVGLRFKATLGGCSTYGDMQRNEINGMVEGVVYEGTFDSFDSGSGEHTFTFDNGVEQSFDIKGGEVRKIYPEPFVFEGADSYFRAPVESKCTKNCKLLYSIACLLALGGATVLIMYLRGVFD
jgi:hypothetical protein